MTPNPQSVRREARRTLIVWPGNASSSTMGARYNPASDTWSAMSAVGAPTGQMSSLVTELIAWDIDAGVGGRYQP